MDFSSSRREYTRMLLNGRDLDQNPFLQFTLWLEKAIASGVAEANTMALATADPIGNPSCRMVLLKELDNRGFVFYTNYRSRKGNDLEANPSAAALFYWPELERQVRVEGVVERTTRLESAVYFHSRSPESRLSAVVSPQSEVIPDRSVLELKWEEKLRESATKEISLPDHWGGFRIIPNRFEFFQGREHRLHDRISYRLCEDHWVVERLAP